MTKTAIRIGPHDHGRHMSLDDFDKAEGQEGYLYELGRGVVAVMDIPSRKHLAQIDALRQQLGVYRTAHPEQINMIAGGGECKIVLAHLDSARHPDLAIYKSPPTDETDLWSRWIPEIVVEVISPGSADRDYVQKREEYLLFGVKEYWIIDAEKREVLVLKRRGGQWSDRILQPSEIYSTRLLPDFKLKLAPIFQAAEVA